MNLRSGSNGNKRRPQGVPWQAQEYGNKAGLLLAAQQAGLPVPTMILLRHGQYPPTTLPETPLVVRSAFSVEDRAAESMAGRFRTELNVAPTAAAVRAAVELVRASARSLPADELAGARLHVLIMSQVDAQSAGVAFSEPGYEDDLVNETDGLGDRLLGGEVAGTAHRLPRLRHRWDRAAHHETGSLRRLARLLHRVRREFGNTAWDVEWADDGTECWLLQIRPVTAPPIRNETFTLANHKEILPELPSTFMTSRIEASAPELLAFYRELDPSLPLDRPFVETFAGRPYLNLSMLTDLMRALGLPTELVTDSYGGEPDVTVPLRPTRLVTNLPTLLRLGLAQMTAVPRANQRASEIRAAAEAVSGATSFAPVIDTFGEVYEGLVQEMGALASSLAPPVALLRRTGTLDYHLGRHRTAAASMLDDLGEVRAGRWSLDEWMGRHGHRGIYESDIARPRFIDEPTPITRSLDLTPNTSVAIAAGRMAFVTTPLWWAARRPMAARENLRSEAMRGFLAIRRVLLDLASGAQERGQLPAAEDLWLLTINEVATLDSGSEFTKDQMDGRRRHREELLAVAVPDTINRFQDPSDRSTAGEGRTIFRGQPLVRGVVTGTALCAKEPPLSLPIGADPATTVLIARSVDAGWVPIFQQVAAVAVEIGGDLSHGSIVLRELRIPSITNVGEIGSAIRTGQAVTLDAASGTLRLIDAKD